MMIEDVSNQIALIAGITRESVLFAIIIFFTFLLFSLLCAFRETVQGFRELFNIRALRIIFRSWIATTYVWFLLALFFCITFWLFFFPESTLLAIIFLFSIPGLYGGFFMWLIYLAIKNYRDESVSRRWVNIFHSKYDKDINNNSDSSNLSIDVKDIEKIKKISTNEPPQARPFQYSLIGLAVLLIAMGILFALLEIEKRNDNSNKNKINLPSPIRPID